MVEKGRYRCDRPRSGIMAGDPFAADHDRASAGSSIRSSAMRRPTLDGMVFLRHGFLGNANHWEPRFCGFDRNLRADMLRLLPAPHVESEDSSIKLMVQLPTISMASWRCNTAWAREPNCHRTKPARH